MSRFLAPIHSWLFSKIKVTEELERKLLKAFQELGEAEVKGLENKVNNLYGEPLEEKPIEELIDAANIHGWLQGRIAAAETRQAHILSYMIAKHGKAAEVIAEATFKDQGEKSASEAKKMFALNSALDIYEALNSYILEGMPCDNVNNTTIKEAEHLQWKNIKCLHKGYWETVAAPVEIMYALRYAWIKAFVETANPSFTHKVSKDGEIIIQDIVLK